VFIYLFGKINVLAEFISHNPSACLKLMKRLIMSFNHSVSIFLIFPFLGIKKVSSFTFLLIRGDHRLYFCCYFFHAANSVVSKHGRGGGTRTPSRRFWRPEFYISSPINVNSLIFRHGIFCHLVANTLNHIPYFSPTVFPLFIRQFANLCW